MTGCTAATWTSGPGAPDRRPAKTSAPPRAPSRRGAERTIGITILHPRLSPVRTGSVVNRWWFRGRPDARWPAATQAGTTATHRGGHNDPAPEHRRRPGRAAARRLHGGGRDRPAGPRGPHRPPWRQRHLPPARALVRGAPPPPPRSRP